MRHRPLIVLAFLVVSACAVQPASPPTVGPTGAPSGSATASPTATPTATPTPPPTPSPSPSASASATATPSPMASQLAQVPEAQHGASPFPSAPSASSQAYVLADATVQAGAGNATARGAIDGDLYTEWSARQGVGASTWITIDLGTTESLSRVDLLPDASPEAVCYFDVQTSTDGTSWSPVAKDAHGLGSNSAPTWASATFNTTRARYVRLQPTDWGARSWVAVWEIKLYP